MQKHWMGSYAAVAAAWTAFGVQIEVPIANETAIAYKYGTNTLVAATQKQTTALDGLPTPIFWFDCTDTTGWEFSEVNGTNFVTKIPDKAGSGRFLTTDVTLQGTSWTGWSATRPPKPPALLSFGNLPGGPALDFGPNHSDQGMVFSPHVYDEAEGATTELRNVGSIVAVWGSANGGGYILGGSAATGHFWCRGWEKSVHTSDSSDHAYYSTIIGDYCGDVKNGIVMLDGQAMAGENTGLNGTWQVAAIQGSTTLTASHGVGLGDTRSGYDRNGGCQFGEMMIFGEQLTEEQLRRVSVALMQKWLGRTLAGWNGDARLDQYSMTPYESTFAQPLAVPAGEKLSMRKLLGGRHATQGVTQINKSGDGTLAIADGSAFGAPITVHGGTLELGVKPEVTGTTNDLPFGVYARFDASERSSMDLSEEGGVEYITKMRNIGFGQYHGKDYYLTAPDCAYRDLRPMLVGARYGSKLPLVYMSHRTADGRYFNAYYDTDAGVKTRQSMQGVVTVFASVSAALGGGHFSTGLLQRNDRWIGDDSYATMILQKTTAGAAKVSYTNAVLWIDGKRVAVTSGYPDAGMHVIAVQLPGADYNTIGAENYYCGTAEADSGAHGGLIFGEIIFYNRTMSEDEVVKVQAYLMKKWLGQRTPDYACATDGIADVQKLVADQSLTIDVPAGKTAKIGSLETDFPVEKTGAGTLEVAAGNDTTLLTVKEGDVRIVQGTPETEDCTVAKGAALHLDASDADTFLINESGGVKYVKRWFSKDAEVGAYQTTAANQPILDEMDTLNGKTVVKMGASGWMSLTRRIANTRTVFWVLGSQDGGGQLLGEVYNSPERNSIDFYRGTATDSTKAYLSSSSSVAVRNGEFYQNGVQTNITQALPTGGWELLSLETTDGVQASALATSRGNTDGVRGNQRLAELIIYERTLSAREKVATRNYLTAKWFPGRELEELPPEDDVDLTLSVASLDVTADASVATTDPISAQELVGAATLVKTGEDKLTVTDFASFEGTIDVQAGTLKLGAALDAEPILKTEGRLVHFDANAGLECTTNADQTITVNKWNDLTGNRYAAPRGSKSVAYLPWGMKGRPAVDMPADASLWWKKGDDYASVTNIGSVFWVIGSQNGGGFILGGGTQDPNETNGQISQYAWHRGGSQGLGATHYGDALAIGSGNSRVTGGTFWLNGAKVGSSSGLSGGWDQMTWLAQTNAQGAAYQVQGAAGFAFDGRQYRYGCQRLGEVIIYDHRVSEEERLQIESYLNAKWGFRESATAGTGAIRLAEGTILETTGNQYVDALSGAGAVEGDVVVRQFVADAAGGSFSVGGRLTIAENAVVTFANLSLPIDGVVDVPLAAATEIAGQENLGGATFVGVPEGMKASIRVVNGVLCARLRPLGMMLLFR